MDTKIHTLKIQVNCVKARPPFNYEQYNTYRTFYTYSATDQDDIDNMRINELHNLGKAGQGTTICMMIDGLGYDDTLNDDYHPSIYKEYSNIIRDVEYFVFNESSKEIDPSFQKLNSSWDTLTPSGKWNEIRKRNAGDTNHTHATPLLSVLVQIAPHAEYMFVEHRGDPLKEIAAIRWIAENNIQVIYDIEVINLYWGDFKDDIDGYLSNYPFFWGTTYDFNDFETWFNDVANSGNQNRKVITVAPATNYAMTFSQKEYACYPAALESVIGVTGVYDGDNGNSSWLLKTEGEGDCNGYGIDIAAIDYYTSLPWEPMSGIEGIAGSCNAATFVTGITAILKQYYDPLNISKLQETFKNTGDLEGNSPEYYGNEEGGAYESLNPYNETIDFGSYPGNYRIAWGIIDSYETYLYIKDNIVP